MLSRIDMSISGMVVFFAGAPKNEHDVDDIAQAQIDSSIFRRAVIASSDA